MVSFYAFPGIFIDTVTALTTCFEHIFGRPYYRSSLWYSISSVCRLSVCLSVTFCIVAKRCILVKKCLKE